MFKRLSFFATLLLITAALSTPAAAQQLAVSPEPSLTPAEAQLRAALQADITPAETTLLPLVYASALKVSTPNPTTIQGNFTVSNNEAAAIGGLQYEVLVLSPAPPPKEDQLVADNPTIFARVRVRDIFAVNANEAQAKSFSVSIPALPPGNYRVRVQLATANDRELGWADVALNFGNATTFAVINAESVEAASKDPITKEERTLWAPLEGVNVAVSQAITLHVMSQKIGPKPLTATAVLRIKKLFSNTEPTSTTIPGTVTIPSGSLKRDLSFPLVAATSPGAYQVILELQNEQQQVISSTAEFRYVVRGPSASIISAQFKEAKFAAGDTATVEFVVVGPADRETALTGQLEVAVLDDNTVAGAVTEKVELTANVVTGTAQVQLDRAVQKNIGLRLTLRSATNEVLASYETHYPDLKPSATPTPAPAAVRASRPLRSVVALGLGLLVVALLGLGGYYWRSRRRPPAATALLLLALGAGLWYFSAAPAHASGIQYTYLINTQQNSLLVFVNAPPHNSQVTNRKVAYEVKVTMAACANQVGTLTMAVLSRSGQLAYKPYNIDKLMKPLYNNALCFINYINWRVYGSIIYADRWGSCNNNDYKTNPLNTAWTLRGYDAVKKTTTGSGRINLALSYTALLDLPLSNPGDKATVWTRAGQFGLASDGGLRDMIIVDDFTWVTLAAPPQCSDSIDNDGDGKIDSADPGCHTDGDAGNSLSYDSADNDETDPPPTATPTATPTPTPAPQCSDSIDNDSDGKIDYPTDPGCSSASDDDETDATPTPTPTSSTAQCSDGLDNDDDGKIDFGSGATNDPGCSSSTDSDEFNTTSGGIDETD